MNRNRENLKKSELENEASSTTQNKSLTTSTEKFTVNQNSRSKRWPNTSIKRSVDDSSEIVIPRQYGEGNKPLFAREDIKTNSCKTPSKFYNCRKSSSSSSSSSPERYRRINKKHHNHRKERPSRLLSAEKEKKRKTPDKVPYFADEKREKERLERRNNIILRKECQIKKDQMHPFSYRRSSRSYRRSRSRSREYSRRRSYSRDRQRHRSLSKSYRRSSSRSRSRGRYRSERAPYIPPMYPVVIATPSASDFLYDPSNWLQHIVPVTHTMPSPYPPFVRPATFPHLPTIPPIRYPMPVSNARYMNYHERNYPFRNLRFKPLHRGSYRPKNP